jgi:hypothetical protein
MAEKEYRVVHGIVQFEPKESEAGGKTVRNLAVRQTGFREQAIRVSATLWPSHAHVEVAEGDVVTLEGSYTRNTGEKDGVKVTYHNISVSRILVHGNTDAGVKTDTVNTDADEPEAGDDEIPF